MPSTHPLELPELLPLVLVYLLPSSLPACARVSKVWYQVCVSFIWNNIDLKELSQPEALIQGHSHLVKKVRIGRMWPQHTTLRFPSLASIHMGHPGSMDLDTIQFIMEHPTVTHLRLTTFSSNAQPAFWDRLLGFHNLRVLAMSSLEIFGTNIDKFWQLCTRLERLDIFLPQSSTLNTGIPPVEFPRMKELVVLGYYANHSPLFLELVRRCPNLTSFQWDAGRSLEDSFVSDLSNLLEAKALSNLEHLATGADGIAHDLFAKIVQNMARITTLLTSLSQDAVRMDLATLIQPHFSNLRVLEVTSSVQAKNPLAQEVLSSCPMLERLRAPFLDGLLVAEGKPWVCWRLKILDIGLCFDPSTTVAHIQPLVFDQLSKLTWLEELSLIGPRARNSLGGTVDMTIDNELHKLSTLRLLRIVNITDAPQKMSHTEVDWILEHWKHLKMFASSSSTSLNPQQSSQSFTSPSRT
ncbi:MAG: hypothetical protein J3Q66DRAFT_385676 [Benniella sp.]|nr:MAG: hypothetical protein J3Q66DRAFT_385676 [Benniella sp.]